MAWTRCLAVVGTVILIFFPATLFSGHVSLPQTGQLKAYYAGDDANLHAGVEWPKPRFTIIHCDEDGPCPDPKEPCTFNDVNDMMRDNLTGLIWARNGELAGSNNGTQQKALTFAKHLTFCGYSDWRVPNILELESLFNPDYCGLDFWLESNGFEDLPFPPYWSSTPRWGMDRRGYLSQYPPETKNLYAFPVRGGRSGAADSSCPANLWRTGVSTSVSEGDDGEMKIGVSWPVPRFIDNRDGTVTDRLTSLMWFKDPNCARTIGHDPQNVGHGAMNWWSALNFVRNINSGHMGISKCTSTSYKDWRLPNRKELLTLVDFSRDNPVLPKRHLFQDPDPQGNHWASYVPWSSTTAFPCGEIPQAFTLKIHDGTVFSLPKSDPNGRAWPVRGITEQ